MLITDILLKIEVYPRFFLFFSIFLCIMCKKGYYVILLGDVVLLFDLIRGGSYSIADVLVYILSALAVIFLTMPVHEFAHAVTAYKLGDHSQKYAGRLTVSPFAHIDWFGALCIILVGFGWARPVQVNPYNFKNPKRDMAFTAAAGPISNLLVAFVGLFFYNLFALIYYKTALVLFVYIAIFFNYIATINISLAVFNLLPVPPLDGSKLLAAFLPDRIYYKFMQYERYIYIALLFLVFSGALDTPISFLSHYIYSGLGYIAGLPFNLIF